MIWMPCWPRQMSFWPLAKSETEIHTLRPNPVSPGIVLHSARQSQGSPAIQEKSGARPPAPGTLPGVRPPHSRVSRSSLPRSGGSTLSLLLSPRGEDHLGGCLLARSTTAGGAGVKADVSRRTGSLCASLPLPAAVVSHQSSVFSEYPTVLGSWSVSTQPSLPIGDGLKLTTED